MRFEQWRNAGFPEGDETSFEPLPPQFEPLPELGEPDMVIAPTRPVAPHPGREENWCHHHTDTFDRDLYVTARELVPGDYVQAVSFIYGHGCSAFGTRRQEFYHFERRTRPIAFAPGHALLIPAGSLLTLEIHFDARAADPHHELPADQSQLRLWTLPEGEHPTHVITRLNLHDVEISIPVDATDVREGTTLAMTDANQPPVGETWIPGEIIGVSPHMRALGQSFRETLRRSDGSELCLVDLPTWAHQWQFDYFFQPSDVVPIDPGDMLIQECVYSNTAQDQPVIHGMRSEPRFTSFGQDVSMEMCLGRIWFRYKWSDLQ
jgi:hypothetical protein